MGSTLHVFLSFGISLPCDHGLNLAISLLCEDIINNQSTNQPANCSFHWVGNLYGTLNVSKNKQQQEITSVYGVVVLLLYYCGHSRFSECRCPVGASGAHHMVLGFERVTWRVQKAN